MTAPTLSPLFDLALEELLDGDVTCEVTGCEPRAAEFHVTYIACGESGLMCGYHVRVLRSLMAREVGVECKRHDHPLTPANVTFRPI